MPLPPRNYLAVSFRIFVRPVKLRINRILKKHIDDISDSFTYGAREIVCRHQSIKGGHMTIEFGGGVHNVTVDKLQGQNVKGQ